MEDQYTGEVFMEIFCNPNIYTTPFATKVLVTLRDDRIRLITETHRPCGRYQHLSRMTGLIIYTYFHLFISNHLNLELQLWQNQQS